ncbi:hypothetical protein [Streptomyces sp. NPDC058291]|jgi:hypothetical protein|uniref:hypothetical protein n=1 Tax=Streptomyces sp. NPDC058291 TaxID=3346427 RepID=UPI0036E3A92D
MRKVVSRGRHHVRARAHTLAAGFVPLSDVIASHCLASVLGGGRAELGPAGGTAGEGGRL